MSSTFHLTFNPKHQKTKKKRTKKKKSLTWNFLAQILKKLLIFSQKRAFSYILSKENLFYISENGILQLAAQTMKIKEPHPGKIFQKESFSYILGNRNARKASYILRNGNPQKILFISGNGTFTISHTNILVYKHLLSLLY